MKKLMLDVEKLSVESFGTAGQPAERGTVAAHINTIDAVTCMGNPKHTCAYHCTYQGPTCFNQC